MIKLVKQTRRNNCTAACLAMLTGYSLEETMKHFHHDWMSGSVPWYKHNPYTYLVKNGFNPLLICSPYDNEIRSGGLSLLTVASLNNVGWGHHIVADATGDEVVYLDPSKQEAYTERPPFWLVDLYLMCDEVR